MRLLSLALALLILGGTRTSILAQQRPGVTCVVPADTSWRPVSWGFDTENHFAVQIAGVTTYAYPVLRRIVPRSAADSAGLRDGDVWRAIDGHDFVREHELARVRGPGIPVRLTIARGDSVFDRIITPGPAHPCKAS